MTRSSLKRRVLDITSQLEAGEKALEVYYATLRLLESDPVQLVDESLLMYKPEDEPRGEVLLPMIPGSIINNYRACIVAHAFRARGYEPLILHCAKGLFRCLDRSIDWDSDGVCDKCSVQGRRTIEAFGLEYEAVSELAPSPDISVEDLDIHSVERHAVDVSKYAKATTRKHLKRYYLDLASVDQRHVYLEILKNGILLADIVEQFFEEREIVATMVMEDPYVQGGIPLEIAENHSVPAYSIEHGFRDGTVVFGRAANRSTLPFFTDPEILHERVETPLTEAQRRRVESLMNDRIQGEDTMYQYVPDTDRSLDRLSDGKTVGMFTNLVWDASLEATERGAYSDPLRWIRETVDAFAERSDTHLVVKTHPAEESRGTEQPVEEYVRSACGPLPSNVEILPPETSVNTYELIMDLDAGIVFNSTVGLEMAYHGCPVVVGGDTHYRDLGFTFDPATRNEYHETLERIGGLGMSEEMWDRARRYMYFFLMEKCIEFPFLTAKKDGSGIQPLTVSYEDVRPGTEPFDSVVSRMISGEPIASL